ncbi:helix-turn-helix transcriptional regulator [Faecalibaculum rodentium]|uniref:helix-turn-helix transcriptional regulator n=1 Tax=Faecalibaculum rodentium TaxID=1702221 RepID=UPI0023F48B84|nr:helix-turn-helix transcriptional regulator [Faecalibaculum rodentium]
MDDKKKGFNPKCSEARSEPAPPELLKLNAEIMGRCIKARRKELGLTQKELAKMINVSTVTIQNYEKGLFTPKGNNLINLEKALKNPLFPYSDYIDYPEGYLREFARELNLDVSEVLKSNGFPASRWISTAENILSELNEKGQEKFISYGFDLAKIPEYRANPKKKDE